MTIVHLVTHSGGFHADEVLSSVVLTRLFPKAEIVRSRSRDWLTPASDRIIYDVGGAYNAAANIFDHHQRGAPLREDGQSYSSFGLVWKHYGGNYLESFGFAGELLEAVYSAFDQDFVLPIDLADNGVVSPNGPLADLTLPALIETLKPVFDDDRADAEDQAFKAALVIARAFVEARIARYAAKQRAEHIVEDAIVAAGPSPILELPRGMPFRPSIVKQGADHLLFVVHPRENDWCLTTIRRGDEGFETRADLPAHWAGLTNGELEAASGVPGASFCHNARFVAAAKTRQAVLAMAELAVREVASAEPKI